MKPPVVPPELRQVERFLQWAEEQGAYLADTDGERAIVFPMEPRQVAALLWRWHRAGMPGPQTVEG